VFAVQMSRAHMLLCATAFPGFDLPSALGNLNYSKGFQGPISNQRNDLKASHSANDCKRTQAKMSMGWNPGIATKALSAGESMLVRRACACNAYLAPTHLQFAPSKGQR
jgi:hypothetical protein